MKQHIEKIKSFGFQVFQRDPKDTWLYFTDGKNIGYFEDGWNGIKCSTVHVPNRTTGTGYGIEISEVSKSELEKAFVFAPAWAGPNPPQIQKFSSIEAFISQSSFHKQYKEI